MRKRTPDPQGVRNTPNRRTAAGARPAQPLRPIEHTRSNKRNLRLSRTDVDRASESRHTAPKRRKRDRVGLAFLPRNFNSSFYIRLIDSCWKLTPPEGCPRRCRRWRRSAPGRPWAERRRPRRGEQGCRPGRTSRTLRSPHQGHRCSSGRCSP